jgi:futalosine hydrolase
MRILIVTATAAELAGYPKNSPDTDFLVTGIGVPDTLFRLQKILHSGRYGCLIQAGVAGSFDTDIQPIGSVALVESDCFADIGFEGNGQFEPLHESALYRAENPETESGWLINTHPLLKNSGLPTVRAITVNRVSDSSIQLGQMQKHFSPVLESMEGAALHLIGNRMQIPYLQLRSVSNRAGVRNKAEWNLPEALKNLHNELNRLTGLLRSGTNTKY